MNYLKSLQTLYYLLDSSGEDHWSEWIKRDIEMWEQNQDVSHHLSAFGGIGSFNDIWICEGNGHVIMKIQEPWINNAIDALKSISFSFAKFGKVDFLPYGNSLLQGYRCLDCGYSEITEYEIECYISKRVVGEMIRSAINRDELLNVVKKIHSLEIDGLEKEREKVKRLASESSITVTQREGWLRPCPKCDTDNTAVYRWVTKEKKSFFWKNRILFTPSQDNLPLANRRWH